ncbi:hypothetical protein M758_11G069400 [Ceratodon purpureus]|nr:hypothetical protein M758_11G069400 [Ceratodon purpureus]
MRKLAMQGRAWGSSAAATAALIVPLLCRGRQARRLVSGRVSWRQRDGVCGVSASQERTLVEFEEVNGWPQILDRSWLLPSAATKTTEVVGREGDWGSVEGELPGSCFHVIRDDLLHPIMGGNKLRKLDALIPLLQARGVTDVVTCGGCQSAHTAAVAVACAEMGMKAHLLLRGERPAIPTGYNLVAGMYGYVTYIPRSEYADRQTMLQKYAMQLAGDPSCVILLNSKLLTESSAPGNSKRVAILNEGAGDCHAILGLIRLVNYLSQPSRFGNQERLRIVVDCGTGTTAIGLAIGIALNG